MTRLRSWGPQRRLERGAASSGASQAAASSAMAPTGRRSPASGPQTINPGRPLMRPASSLRCPGSGCRSGRETRAARSASGSPSRPGVRGSRRGTLRCTGPGSGQRATATAWVAARQAVGSRARSGSGSSRLNRLREPNSPGWSMVWLAPHWRSSGGRSADSRISGTRARSASVTPGSHSLTAPPEVATKATGAPPARAAPKAKKAAPRSSSTTWVCRSGCRAAARVRGVEREPGERTTRRTPAPLNPSNRARPQA